MRHVRPRDPCQKPPRRRPFAPVDLENLAPAADEQENPDWLVGAN